MVGSLSMETTIAMCFRSESYTRCVCLVCAWLEHAFVSFGASALRKQQQQKRHGKDCWCIQAVFTFPCAIWTDGQQAANNKLQCFICSSVVSLMLDVASHWPCYMLLMLMHGKCDKTYDADEVRVPYVTLKYIQPFFALLVALQYAFSRSIYSLKKCHCKISLNPYL